MKKKQTKEVKKYLGMEQGITLVALVVTIVVLLILAGVSIGVMTGENGIFNKAEQATKQYGQAKAREMLEQALSGARIEKYTNKQYNENKFLDKYIIDQIKGTEIRGDVAIVGKYAFELDRSVPEIGKYSGLAEDFAFPSLTVTDPKLSDDNKSGSFTITAKEEKNGITRIEVWLGGKIIESLTKTYGNEKDVITLPVEVNKDGQYTVKVYGKINGNEIAMARKIVTVTGIVPIVEFNPPSNEKWAKQHEVQLIVKETGDKVKNIKYKWTTDGANAPTEFTEECPTDNKIIGRGEENKAETYYLWVLVTTESGKTSICGSEGFNLDNEGPIINEFTYNPTSEISYKFGYSAKDNYSEIAGYKIYVNGKITAEISTNEENGFTKDYSDLSVYFEDIKLSAYDSLGNITTTDITNRNEVAILNKYEKKIIKEGTYGSLRSRTEMRIYSSHDGWTYSLTGDVLERDGELVLKNPIVGSPFEDAKANGSIWTIDTYDRELRLWAVLTEVNPGELYCSVQDYEIKWEEKCERGNFIRIENRWKTDEIVSTLEDENGLYEVVISKDSLIVN